MSSPPLIQVLRKPPEAVPARRPRARESCEFCGADLEAEHRHIVNLVGRTLLCVCRPCHALFDLEGAGGLRFRAVPSRYVKLGGQALDGDRGWEALNVPIGLAFFFRNSATGRVAAFYPSPAGPTESDLGLEQWDELIKGEPQLQTLAPDVEGILVRRPLPLDGVRPAPPSAFIVPIDVCYELAGRIRQLWQGFHGGADVWRSIDDFFARVDERAGGEAR